MEGAGKPLVSVIVFGPLNCFNDLLFSTTERTNTSLTAEIAGLRQSIRNSIDLPARQFEFFSHAIITMCLADFS